MIVADPKAREPHDSIECRRRPLISFSCVYNDLYYDELWHLPCDNTTRSWPPWLGWASK